MTRALVTGGAGFIGSHTVDRLLERGYAVRILDALEPRVHPKGKPAWVPEEADLMIGDVADPADLARAMSGCEFVIHLAAYQDYLPEFSRFVHTNAESTALIFELAVANPKKFPLEKVLLASSQSVAGEGKYRCDAEDEFFWPDPRPLAQLESGEWDIPCPQCGSSATPALIDEATCNNPHTAYGISKYASELLAFRLGRRYGIGAVAMRYTYVQGARNSFHNTYSGIARRFALRLMTGLPPVCYEDGLQVRDYVNVSDVAAANVLALEADVSGVALNVGGGRGITVMEFARLMLSAYGSSLDPVVDGSFRLGDTRHTISDLGRMTELGWEPTFAIEDNVMQYVEWLDTQGVTTEHLQIVEQEMLSLGVVRTSRRH